MTYTQLKLMLPLIYALQDVFGAFWNLNFAKMFAFSYEMFFLFQKVLIYERF